MWGEKIFRQKQRRGAKLSCDLLGGFIYIGRSYRFPLIITPFFFFNLLRRPIIGLCLKLSVSPINLLTHSRSLQQESPLHSSREGEGERERESLQRNSAKKQGGEMALAKEIMGCSVIERSSFVSTSKVVLSRNRQAKQNLGVNPALIHRRRVSLRKGSGGPAAVAAVSEDLVKAVPENVVKFKARAVVTVRQKNKEDLKETIAKHLDAFTDRIGRNVVLQLISTEIDPSKFFPPQQEKKGKIFLYVVNISNSRPSFGVTRVLGFFFFWVPSFLIDDLSELLIGTVQVSQTEGLKFNVGLHISFHLHEF